jgi:hypothetical protein
MTQQKSSPSPKDTLTTLLILVNQQQHFQAGVSVDQNPLHQRVSGGLRCKLYHAHSIRKRYGNHGSFEDLLLLVGKANWKKKRDCPTDGMWDSLALNIWPFFFLVLVAVLSLLVSFVLRCCPIWDSKERGVFLIVSSVCVCVSVCAIVVYPRAADYHRAV